MPYLRIKWIKGHPYLYEQASYREGKKVRTKHIRYVGKIDDYAAWRSQRGKTKTDKPEGEKLADEAAESNETKAGGEDVAHGSLYDIELYHGSKSTFDKFDMGKYGTGEGGDRYGEGAYLTDSKDLAEFYANAVAKKDFVDKYEPKGIFGTDIPVYKASADKLAEQNAKVTKFIAQNLRILDAETYRVDDDIVEAFARSQMKRGMSLIQATDEVNYKLNFARKNKAKINNYRGELDYLISQITEGDKEATEMVMDAIRAKGYEGVRYPSNMVYEGEGGYNYAIYNTDKLKGVPSPTSKGNVARLPADDMIDVLLNKITGVKQNTDDFADYLQSDGQTVKAIVDDFIDYATVSTKSDAEVNSIVGNFISRGDDAIVSYKQSIGEYKGLKDSESLQTVAEMNSALSEFTFQLDKLKSAKTRTDKVVALDGLISAEHSRGGKFLTHGYGIGDIDRGDAFLGDIMDWLRNQNEYTPESLSKATAQAPKEE